jgi:type I restriction enzyme S subunit
VEQLAAGEPASLTDGPFGSNLKTSHYTEKGPRVIRLQNIGDGVFRDESVHISEEHFDRLRRHEAASGDVVIAMLGETLPRACIVPSHVGPAIVKADCVRLRVHPALASARFVAYALNSQQLRTQAAALVHGVGRPRLGLKWLRTLQAPLAPRGEQHRIVEAIESYLTRLDDAVATLERVQRNLKRYRASVLKAAVEGRLVPTEAELARAEGRDYEPASVLLERILAERRRRWEEAELAKMKAKGKAPKDDKWKGKYKEPARPDADEYEQLPEGWTWASLEALTSSTRVICYGILMPKDNVPDGVPYVKVRDMRSGVLNVDSLQRTSHEIAAKYHRSTLKGGDLLLAIRGTYGRVVDVPAELEGGNITQDSARLDVLPGVHRRYAKWMLLSPDTETFYKRVARGVAVKGVNIADVRATPVPLPPQAEQERIVQEVEDLLSIEEVHEGIFAANQARLARLRQSILKWAFEGRLVDQDPTDEPASILLERIRAEREAKPAQRARTRRRARAAKSDRP